MFPKRVQGEKLVRRIVTRQRVRETLDQRMPYIEAVGQEDANAALKAAKRHRKGNGR
jgi:hypothetical protein